MGEYNVTWEGGGSGRIQCHLGGGREGENIMSPGRGEGVREYNVTWEGEVGEYSVTWEGGREGEYNVVTSEGGEREYNVTWKGGREGGREPKKEGMFGSKVTGALCEECHGCIKGAGIQPPIGGLSPH